MRYEFYFWGLHPVALVTKTLLEKQKRKSEEEREKIRTRH
jgi:hypothetical protein